MRDISWLEGQKAVAVPTFLVGEKWDSVTETGPPANNAMPNRGYRRWGRGTAVHKVRSSVVLSSELWFAYQKLHLEIAIGKIRLLPLAASL